MPSRRRPISDSSDGRSRPTWWVLLAITLAIVAVTFAHIGASDTPEKPSQFSSAAPTSRDVSAAPKWPLHSSKVNVQFKEDPGFGQPAPSQQLIDPSPAQGAPHQSPTTTLASSSTTTAPASNGNPPSSAQTFSGYLSYPDNVESFLTLSARTGRITASATWSIAASLGLSIACSSSGQTIDGNSPLQVSAVAVNASCTIKLIEAVPVKEPIPYTLNVLNL